MGRRKLKFVLPKLNDRRGDLSKSWYVEYSYRDEKTDKLERFRIYEGFSSLSTKEERYIHAEKIVDSYTKKILSDWNPFDIEKVVYHNNIGYDIHNKVYGSKVKSDKNLLYYINLYLEEKSSVINAKSKQDYTSKLRSFYHWMFSNGDSDIFVQNITNDIVFNYIIHLAEDKKLEGRTIKDTKQRISSFFNWLINKNIIAENPAINLPTPKQKKDHSAQPMTQKEASKLLNFIKQNDKQLYLFCAMIFYCAIRPGTELRLLKIKDINIFTERITIRSENAKTSQGIINMPPKMVEIIEDLEIMLSDKEYYVFGKDGKPGEKPWGKNHFRVEFNKYRDQLGFSKEYKLYSWKCTGAILFSLSGAPLAAVRDHCRHKSTAYTDFYLSKRIGHENDYVKNKFPEL